MSQRPQVVIVGGGFGGLNVARGLRRADVDITLIDRRNFHLFQPLLYQVATGGLSPANIAAPLRAILARQTNARVLLGEVTSFDAAGRAVLTAADRIPYDWLVVATGAQDSYFGHDDWEAVAPGLKTIEDATEIRGRVLSAFEEAERLDDPQARAAWLTFVIVGGGPTGVELAGALAELARHTLKHNFRHIDPASAQIVLVEGEPHLLPPYPDKLREKARSALSHLGVTVETGARVVALRDGAVEVRHGDKTRSIASRTILWAAGVQANPLGRALAEAAGATTDRAGRVIVEPDCSLAGHPEIFVIGDLANFADAAGKPLPGVAPVAIQQGRHVARTIRRRLRGEPARPFRYCSLGNMATIGRARAVADFGWLQLSGYPAWLAWLFVHLINLVGFQNRLLVLVQWGINYFTRNRAARLITEEPAAQLVAHSAASPRIELDRQPPSNP